MTPETETGAEPLATAQVTSDPEAGAGAEPTPSPHSQTEGGRAQAQKLEVVAGTLHAVEGGTTVVVELPGGKLGVISTDAFEKLPRLGARIEFGIVPDAADDQGRARLQLVGDDEKVTWKSLELGMTVDAMVTGMNVGGLELKIAGSKIRAFMPNSQIDLSADPDPTLLLNHKLQCKIISIEKRRRRVVLSRRAILEKEHRKQRLKQIRSGQELTGKVRKIEPFGVFVDLEPGLDGLVRIGDLAWHRVDDPGQVVQIGQEVKVKVLKVERGRLVLGLRQTQPNPWDEAPSKYRPGAKVRGKVVRTTDFGAFIELEPGVEGMIHISQVSERRVESVEQAVREGQIVEAKVLEVDPRKQRIALSIRALSQPEVVGRAPEASREEIRRYVKPADKAKAVESLMAKFGGREGLKGGIG